jgi:hypothetical protein
VYGQIRDFSTSSNIYDDPDNKIFIWVNTMIGNVKRAINGTYHSVSSKHLPRYLAEFCFRFNGRFCVGDRSVLSSIMQPSLNLFLSVD